MDTLCALLHDIFLPKGNVFPRSWYLFREIFSGLLSSRWKRVDICVKEHHIFAPGENNCPKCQESRYRPLKLANNKTKQVSRKWFYSISFIDQLRWRFFSDPDWVKVRIIAFIFMMQPSSIFTLFSVITMQYFVV